MSTCAFCGSQHRLGRHFLAHRISTLRLRTVKVCERCLEQAKDAGYQIAEREPGSSAGDAAFQGAPVAG
ncbi:MAG: hypothetical protein JO343_04215 [Candidatus Eremiobacteraeota bacterium]|nr:hypothetical protein [Candidatus Eremiobacteraeota bacterium]